MSRLKVVLSQSNVTKSWSLEKNILSCKVKETWYKVSVMKRLTISWGRWLIFVTMALKVEKQDDWALRDSLGYVVSLKPAWAT